MSDTNINRSRSVLLTVLLLVLFVIVVFQGWYLVNMKNQVEALRSEQASLIAASQVNSHVANKDDSSMTAETVQAVNDIDSLTAEQESAQSTMQANKSQLPQVPVQPSNQPGKLQDKAGASDRPSAWPYSSPSFLKP